jgi:hypothetical protein
MLGIDFDVSSISRPTTHPRVFECGKLDHAIELDGKGIVAGVVVVVLVTVCHYLDGSKPPNAGGVPIGITIASSTSTIITAGGGAIFETPVEIEPGQN